MKRCLTILFFFVFAFSAAVDAKPRARSRSHAKAPAAYCAGVKVITDCADEGCGPNGDPELNKRKNIRSDGQQPIMQTISWMKELTDPVNFTAENRNRDELKQLGEGQKITVVAWALDVRQESKETCNCGLTAKKDTDNHIVLVDPRVKKPTLTRDEVHSITVEFTPRVRLDHPNFTREKLAPLIDPNWTPKMKPHGKVLVRVTGLLMFDSQHFLSNPLTRENNWEIHPILKMEYCPGGKTCRADSDANWEDLDKG